MRPILNVFTISSLAAAIALSVPLRSQAAGSQARSSGTKAHVEHVTRSEERIDRPMKEERSAERRQAINNSREQKERTRDLEKGQRLGNDTNTGSYGEERGNMSGAKNPAISAQQERSVYVGDFNWKTNSKPKTPLTPSTANTVSQKPVIQQKHNDPKKESVVDDKKNHLSSKKQMEDHRQKIDKYLTDLRGRLHDADEWLVRKIRHDIEKSMHDVRESQRVAMNDPVLIGKWENILRADLLLLSHDMQLLDDARNNRGARSHMHAARK